MAEIVNLRMARKRAARQQRDSEAAANRTEHGIGKDDRALAEARRSKAKTDLDRHRIERGDVP